MKIKKIQFRNKTVWSPKYYVLFYKLALQGLDDRKIAGSLGMPYDTFRKYKKTKKIVRWALKEARRPRDKSSIENVLDHVYDRLPEDLKTLHSEIMDAGKDNRNPYERVRKLLANKGEGVKKQLFLYSLVRSNFNKSKAMRSICITGKDLQVWYKDPEFVQYLEQVQEGMKDFYESALVTLVEEGDTQATIFANKTKNKDRGYGETLDVKHQGEINHKVSFDISKLSLSAQKEVYNLLEEQEKEKERLEEVKLSGGNQLQIPHIKNGKKNESRT